MMTTVYFVRHAQADNTVRDGRIRPLTEKGMNDRLLVTKFLQDKGIDKVLSSPFKRAVDTLADFACKNGFIIETVEDFRERKSDIDFTKVNFGFETFMQRQWEDFNYTFSDGECLSEVQKRNIAALNKVLTNYKGKNVVIGTHGTALSTIINYYDNTYSFQDFLAMVDITPWVVRMDFNDDGCVGMEKINLFQAAKPDYDKCVIRTASLGALRAYRYTVIFARYKNKWMYCRAKKRDAYETAGGHIEQNESTLDCAKRELFEETGAVKFDITPAFDYAVHLQTGYSNGQVFFANIKELADIPNYEMVEVKLFDTVPDKMRFPCILPKLYDKMQMWLNLQSAKDEVWDIYDSQRILTDRKHRRADPLKDGDFHLVVHVWLQNSEKEFLITKRASGKGYPNMWECTGGSAIAGDNSLTAAMREVKEETGLEVNPKNGRCVLTFTREDNICDVWLFRQDFDIRNVVFQENETTDAKYASASEIRRMIESGEFINFHYIDELFAELNKNC